ncbi:glycosyltransferase [Psychrobacter phenylpyruvicus]|uniref:N-glycosyltransferase n=1 Tax=Psychrobacter phenylpyruvicus TaxID=29432 RepID=A0A379LPW7_9GAMM|nr:glycosyltransferase [Psychrobacter phenylpyruvicus]SUD98805.1 N-glycosyltransferase [Psychrobacter phenylpyruvicus]SUD98907.1 N-glycosyltransferase [Psychrobacter phenylpyruvicus]
MDFSVLLSVYINEKPLYLDEALSSIWDNQISKPNEIIIVEDGELTEELYKILDLWSSKLPLLIKRVPLEENLGLGKALNIGLEYCTNEWVFRMDSDDICLPDRFSKQIEFITKNPDIDIFSGSIQEIDITTNNPIATRIVPESFQDILKYSYYRSPFNHVAVAYKKSVVQSVGGYQHHMYMEDYNLWIRILAAGYKAANLQDILVVVRAGDDMIGRRRGRIYIESEWQLFKLKRSLNYQPVPHALLVYFARSIPRLLPSNLLVVIYSKLRDMKSH